MGVIMHCGAEYTGAGSDAGLSDLADVRVANPQDGQSLVYDATSEKWENQTIEESSEIDDTTTSSDSTWSSQKIDLEISQLSGSLVGLNDVDVSNPSTGQVLTYNESSDEWSNEDIPSEIDDANTASDSTWSSNKIQLELSQLSGSLIGLSDVDVSSPTDGQMLAYDSESGEWENRDVPSEIDDSGTASDSTWSSTKIQLELSQLSGSLVGLSDVDLDSPASGQVLTYDSESDAWENQDIPSEIDDANTASDSTWSSTKIQLELNQLSGSLVGLTDVSVSNPSDGQVLTYDVENDEWENQSIPSEIDDSSTGSDATWSAQKIQLELSQLSGSLVGLSDVDVSSPTEGQVLTYDSESDSWGNESIPSEIDDTATASSSTWSSTKIQLELSQLSGSLIGLTDVDVSTPTDGQALVYDANDDKWENKDIGIDVDQTYDSTSTNPQSGMAVAEAVAAVDEAKADLVTSATSGDLAGLDSNGNLTDSGIASDIFPSTATSSNKLATASDLPDDLNDLDDVTITSPSNNQIIAYNATSGKWENKTGQETIGGVVFKGSIFFANIPTTGLVNGDGYNIKDAFTTDSRFIEGAGVECLAGTDIAWVDSESKWNILTPSGVHSFNGRTGAVMPAANDYSASDVGLGNVVNTGDSATPVSGGTTKFTTGGAYTELNKKADKVDSATNGDFAGLDANGNLTDSGINANIVPSTASSSNKLATESDIPDVSNFVEKSSTSGLLKNDGTVDTTAYISDVSDKADKTEAYLTNDTAETDIADGDYVPFYDTSATAKRKSLWSNIKSVLKTYFDTLYAAISHSHTVSDISDFPTLGSAASLEAATSGDASPTEVVIGDDSRLTDARTPVSHSHITSDITDFPTLGSASALDVPTSGDASLTEVVLGSDSRLTDARTPVSHTHTSSDVTDLGTAAVLDVPESGNASSTEVVLGSDSRLTDARTPVSHTHLMADVTDLGTAAGLDVPASGDASQTEVVIGTDSRLTDARTPVSHTHSTSDIIDFPTLGTASALDVPESGDAGLTEVVIGDDSRLTDARNAADVSAWAKEATKPDYTASEVGVVANPSTPLSGSRDALGAPVLRSGSSEVLSSLTIDGTLYTMPEQIQTDWNQIDSSAKDYLKNKPGVETAVSGGTAKSLVTTGEKYTWNGKAEVEDVEKVLITLSKSEYNALSTTEKNDPTKVYYVDDDGGADDGALSRAENRILGAKNFLRYPYDGGGSGTSIFTINSDGSITVASGTHSTRSYMYLEYPYSNVIKFTPPVGEYICSVDGLVSGISVVFEQYNGSTYVRGSRLSDTDNSIKVNVDYSDFDRLGIFIDVDAGTVLSEAVTIYPMLRLATDPDISYAPYAKTNKELTDDTQYIVRLIASGSAGDQIRIPNSGTDSRIKTTGCEVKAVAQKKSDGTPYKFTAVAVYDGYAQITLGEAVSNVYLGVKVTKNGYNVDDLVPMKYDVGVGTTIVGSNSVGKNVTVAHATVTEIDTLTINDPGKWLLLCYADWTGDSSSGAGIRQISLQNQINSVRMNTNVTCATASTKECYQQHVTVRSLTPSGVPAVFRLYGYQTSTNTLTCYPYMQAIKISD